MQIQALDHIVLVVADVERSLDFYAGKLGLPAERVEAWRAGELSFPSLRVSAGTIIDLVRGQRSGENVNHFCLVAAGDIESVQRELEGKGLATEGPPRSLSGARGDALGVYVRDPDGNRIEIRVYRPA